MNLNLKVDLKKNTYNIPFFIKFKNKLINRLYYLGIDIYVKLIFLN